MQKRRVPSFFFASTIGEQARRSRGSWGGYCPPKYRGGGAQPPLALPSGSYCERVFFEIAVLSVTVSLNRVSLASQTYDQYNGLGTRIRTTSPGPQSIVIDDIDLFIGTVWMKRRQVLWHESWSVPKNDTEA